MIQYLEVEDRAVIIKAMTNKAKECWVWHSCGWSSAPGLLGTAMYNGELLTEVEFRTRFPNIPFPILLIEETKRVSILKKLLTIFKKPL